MTRFRRHPSNSEIEELLTYHAANIWIPITRKELRNTVNAIDADTDQRFDEVIDFANQHFGELKANTPDQPVTPAAELVGTANYAGRTARTKPRTSQGPHQYVTKLGFFTSLLIGFGALALAAAVALTAYLVLTSQTLDVELKNHIWFNSQRAT